MTKYTIAAKPYATETDIHNAMYCGDTPDTEINCGDQKVNALMQCIWSTASAGKWGETRLMQFEAEKNLLKFEVSDRRHLFTDERGYRYCLPKYSFELQLTRDADNNLGYVVELKGVDFSKVAADMNKFIKGYAYAYEKGQKLVIYKTNHTELKMLLTCIKNYFKKYNICEHYLEFFSKKPLSVTFNAGSSIAYQEHLDANEPLAKQINAHAVKTLKQTVASQFTKHGLKITADNVILPNNNGSTFLYLGYDNHGYVFEKRDEHTKVIKTSNYVEISLTPSKDENDKHGDVRGLNYDITYIVDERTKKIKWRIDVTDNCNGYRIGLPQDAIIVGDNEFAISCEHVWRHGQISEAATVEEYYARTVKNCKRFLEIKKLIETHIK